LRIFGLQFLRARVARRIFGLFVVGVLLPIGLLAGLTYTAVTDQLRSQAEAKLLQLSDDTSQSILARIDFFTTWLRGIGALAITASDVGGDPEQIFGSVSDLLPSGVAGLAVVSDGRVRTLAGSMGDLPALTVDDREHLADGGAVLKSAADESPFVDLIVVLDGLDGSGPLLWASIVADSLWAAGIAWTTEVEDFCVLDARSRPFYCSRGEESALASRVPPAGSVPGSVRGLLERSADGTDRIGAWHDVYLRASYNADPWLIAVSQSQTAVYSPVDNFVYNVLVALVVGIGLVLLFTNRLVRRTMGPLEMLTEGTRRMGEQDLSTRVDVQSEDEFGQLARSFNEMAGRLDHQFRQINAGRAIDQAVISASDEAVVTTALLEGLGEVASPRRTAALLLDSRSDDEAVLYLRESTDDVVVRTTELGGGDRSWIHGDVSPSADVAVDLPDAFSASGFGSDGTPPFVLRLVVHGEPLGAVALVAEIGNPFTESDVGRIRQLVDQTAVALNELKLRRDLEEMSWEALRALANAIDAKSKWTSGHSERVTDLSLELARHLQLDEESLDILHRGGLLHDLGKIGVPVDILDHPGPLNGEMREAINAHPVIGARILEPIRAFQPILPILLYHHERWDGQGYPEGLAGTDIHPLARLLTVADCFDAMVSARPYRAAMDPWVVLDEIREGSGTAFDPEIVVAMVELMEGGWLPREAGEEVVIGD
jgi:HAMP domain-containing protein